MSRSKFQFSPFVRWFTAVVLLAGFAAAVRADPPVAAATGSITGKVVDSSGSAVAGAIVRLALLPGNMHRGRPRWHRPQPGRTVWHHITFGVTVTAGNGTFTVNNAPVGRYRVMAFRRGVGHGQLRRPIVVSVGQNVDAGSITLRKPHRRR